MGYLCILDIYNQYILTVGFSNTYNSRVVLDKNIGVFGVYICINHVLIFVCVRGVAMGCDKIGAVERP